MAEAPWVQILCINKSNRTDPHDAIDFFGGVNEDGGRWRQSLAEMIKLIETGQFRFYVSVKGDSVAVIVAVSRFGNKYLKTVPDGDMPNNLLSLPECPR